MGTFVVGIVGGVLASFAAWYLVWRVIAPRGCMFSTMICSYPSDQGDKYRVKFVNKGSRALMEVEFHALLFLPVGKDGETHPLISIPLLEDRYAFIGGQGLFRKRRSRFFEVSHRVLILRPSRIDQDQLARLPTEQQNILGEDDPQVLERLLSLDGASLQICCTASDAITGSRRAMLSLADRPSWYGWSR